MSALAYCPDWPGVPGEFLRSELVFVATVKSEAKVYADGDFFDGISYTLAVTERLKGEPKALFVVFSENSSGRFPMNIGASYLVFTSLESGTLADQPAYTVNYCGNSGLVVEKEAALAQARRLAKHSAQQRAPADGPRAARSARG